MARARPSWSARSATATASPLPAQIRDYGVGKATIGLTFFTAAAGFMLGSFTAGPLIHRFGTRIALVVGGGVFVAASLYMATRLRQGRSGARPDDDQPVQGGSGAEYLPGPAEELAHVGGRPRQRDGGEPLRVRVEAQ